MAYRTLMRVLVMWLLLAGVAEAATLRLTCVDGGVDVELAVALTGRPAFRLEDVVQGDPGMTKLVSGFSARDASGVVPLERKGDLELVPARDVRGLVTLSYRARSVAASEPGARFGLRHDATGISGVGGFFLVLPDKQGTEKTVVTWKGCRGTDAELDGPLADLRSVAFAASTAPPASGPELTATWLGNPGFDVAEATRWASAMFRYEREFFGDPKLPYRLIVRVLEQVGERANGTGQRLSLLTSIGPKTPWGRRLKVNLAHEMLHRWIGLDRRVPGPEGTGYWFTEGFTVYYASLLAWRAGLMTLDEFVDELNFTTERHFENPRVHATNEEIRAGFFADQDLSRVPYTRGALYAAELDAALRRKEKSLDAIVRQLHGSVDFRAVVQRELGSVARFDAVIVRGEHPDPPANAFGPCIDRIPAKVGWTWVRVKNVAPEQCHR
jgi:M61 glycyl aminopeptidase